MLKKMTLVELYTDGACRRNPGPGGWGVLLRCGSHEKELSGAVPETTNNQMELTAAIEGLNALHRSCTVQVYTDSEYVRRGITEWLPKWQRKAWKNASGQAVKNKELWQALATAEKRHTLVEWHWVKGHSGHIENERVDALAGAAIDALLAK